MNIQRIINIAAGRFDVTPESIRRPKEARTGTVVLARGAVIYALRRGGLSIPRIGEELGYSDHTGALNLLMRTERRIECDTAYCESVRFVMGAK